MLNFAGDFDGLCNVTCEHTLMLNDSLTLSNCEKFRWKWRNFASVWRRACLHVLSPSPSSSPPHLHHRQIYIVWMVTDRLTDKWFVSGDGDSTWEWAWRALTHKMYTLYNCALEWRMTAARCASRRQVPGRTTWRSLQPATRTRTRGQTRTANTPRTMTRTTTRRRKTDSTSTSVPHTTNIAPLMAAWSRKYFCETRLLFGEVWFWNEDQHGDASWSEERGQV